MSDPWYDGRPYANPPPQRRSRRRGKRLFVGTVAGATALAVALAAGSIAIEHQKHGFAAGALLSGTSPAADSAASKGGAKPAPIPKASPPPDPVLSVAQVESRVRPGVVIINSQLAYQNAEAAGTGMVLSPTGEILTNNHVIDGATQITVLVADSQRSYTARVVGTVPDSDVAVLQLEGASGLATIPVGNSDGVAAGQAVVAIGNAGGRGTLSVVTGSVTSTNRTITASDASGQSSERLTGMIEVEAPIKAGDSGGPLSSRAGKVIGMDTAASTSRNADLGAPTFGFAIPINRALSIAARVQSGDTGSGVVRRGYLGVQVRTSDSTTNTGGAEVVLTTPGSPAMGAGLEVGDVITALDGQPVDSADTLTNLLQQSKPGQSVRVDWTDQFGDPQSADVTLSKGPAD